MLGVTASGGITTWDIGQCLDVSYLKNSRNANAIAYKKNCDNTKEAHLFILEYTPVREMLNSC